MFAFKILRTIIICTKFANLHENYFYRYANNVERQIITTEKKFLKLTFLINFVDWQSCDEWKMIGAHIF